MGAWRLLLRKGVGLILAVLVAGGAWWVMMNGRTAEISGTLYENDKMSKLLTNMESRPAQSKSAAIQTAPPATSTPSASSAVPVSPAPALEPTPLSASPRPRGETSININTAAIERLTELPGIGPSKAKAIVEYRDANHGFRTLDELMKVKGIGKKTFETLQGRISL